MDVVESEDGTRGIAGEVLSVLLISNGASDRLDDIEGRCVFGSKKSYSAPSLFPVSSVDK